MTGKHDRGDYPADADERHARDGHGQRTPGSAAVTVHPFGIRKSLSVAQGSGG